MRILLIEDDAELGHRLRDRLESAGFAVDYLASAGEAMDWPDLAHGAAIILDLGLPDGDGLDLLRHWRQAGETIPILILTARGGWRDKVDGLNAGADDFVVKPVRFEELLARLHALLRRREGRAVTTLTIGNLVIDPDAKSATMAGTLLTLSRTEFNLLHTLMRRPGHVHSQSDLLEQLYDLDAERDANAIEAQISRLRRKIGRDRISTLRGFGYRFEA